MNVHTLMLDGVRGSRERRISDAILALEAHADWYLSKERRKYAYDNPPLMRVGLHALAAVIFLHDVHGIARGAATKTTETQTAMEYLEAAALLRDGWRPPYLHTKHISDTIVFDMEQYVRNNLTKVLRRQPPAKNVTQLQRRSQ